MKEKNRIVQSLWVGKSVSMLEKLSFVSFIDNGHEYHLYTYDDIDGIPDGVVVKDANDILPESKIFTYKNGSYAGFANWFRYELINKTGFYWVDSDIICLKPFNFDDDIVMGLQNRKTINNAVIRFPKNHPVLEKMIFHCQNPHQFLPYDGIRAKARKLMRKSNADSSQVKLKWGELGPVGLTKIIKSMNLFEMALSPVMFYPIPFSKWTDIFFTEHEEELPIEKTSYGIHFWNEMLRRDHIDKNGSFPYNSLVEKYKRKHNIG